MCSRSGSRPHRRRTAVGPTSAARSGTARWRSGGAAPRPTPRSEPVSGGALGRVVEQGVISHTAPPSAPAPQPLLRAYTGPIPVLYRLALDVSGSPPFIRRPARQGQPRPYDTTARHSHSTLKPLVPKRLTDTMPPRVRSPGLKPRPVYTRDTRPADTPMPPTVQRYRTSSSPRISSGSRSRPMTSCATNQMMATRPHNATATSYKAAATVPSHAPPPPVCASAIPTHRAI